MKHLATRHPNLHLSRLGQGHTDSITPAGIAESIRSIHAALDGGINYLNTADFYDSGAHELLIREALCTRKREDVFISVKFGSMVGPNGRYYGIDVRPHAVKNYLAYTLKRLGTDYIDLYQPARINPHIPVEDTIGAVAEMVKAGYVRHVGISEVNAETLRRAHAVHPISLVEMQYSLLNRSIEASLIHTARELGIGIVVFGILFHGLIGSNTPGEKAASITSRMPPHLAEKLKQGIARLEGLKPLAAEKGITVQQLAIAWVLAQGDDILTLVGSRTVQQLHDTIKTINIELTHADLQRIDQIIPKEYATTSSMLPMNLDQNGLFIK